MIINMEFLCKPVTLDVFENFLTPVPSKAEQRKICSYLKSKIDNVNSIIKKTKLCICDYKKLRNTCNSNYYTRYLQEKKDEKNKYRVA